MTSIAERLIEELLASGVRDYFGVQGGACAHLIRASSLHDSTNFVPVLNEQAAGLAAHGYFKATGRPAGAIVTTGPGFSNLVTGMVACYVDRVPLVVLCGQVSGPMNMAADFGTRMYGFQELDHAAIAAHFAEYSLCVSGPASLARAINHIRNLEMLQGPLFIEIQDDLQRETDNLELGSVATLLNVDDPKTTAVAIEDVSRSLQQCRRPVILIGAGVSDLAFEDINTWATREQIPLLFSWGAQRHLDMQAPLHRGLFGNHSPGRGNQLLRNSDLLVCVGIGLLQHQVGKDRSSFASNAEIIYVNSDFLECARLSHDFPQRSQAIVCHDQMFADALLKGVHNPDTDYWLSKSQDPVFESSTPVEDLSIMEDLHEGVSVLMEILQQCPSQTVVFSDAGSTLSWTYQAANLVNAPPIYTAYNLHTMGYAIPASIGASIGGIKTVVSICGDGGFMMNLQELPQARSVGVKSVVLDNRGYGIIRQTQEDYFDSDFSGSSPDHPFAPLPEYDVAALSSASGIPSRRIKPADLTENLDWFFDDGQPRNLVIDIEFSLRVMGAGL